MNAVNAEFASNLKKAYRIVRMTEPRVLEKTEVYEEELGEGEQPKMVELETNGVRVMLYNKEFDLAKYKLGLRFNENWVADTVKFGHQQSRVRLCCIVGHPNAVMTSWRDSSSVKPLTAEFPKVAEGEFASSDSEATIVGQKKAIVFGSTALSNYFSPKENLSFMIVDEKGVTKMTFSGRKWIAEEL